MKTLFFKKKTANNRPWATWLRRQLRKLAFLALALVLVSLLSVYLTIDTTLPHLHNVYSAAKLVDGEARGEPVRGQKAVFASILVRMEDKHFPATMHDVMFQPYPKNDKLLQYNAMGDHVHENLSTESGQAILRRVAWWYVQDKLGIFRAPKEARGAHSYCTPVACQRQIGYFGQFKLIGVIGGHEFYGGQAEETKARVATSAPLRSIRPLPRPQSSFLSEQSGKKIDDIVAVIAKP